MREIKFRGKSRKTGEWFYGNLFDKDSRGNTHISTTRKGCMDVDPDTVGQFTGLHDKNGKEIYEGDIVRFDDTPYDVYARAYGGEVVMCRGCWSVKTLFYGHYMYPNLFKDDFADRKTLLLGNIHDNPELLKGGIE